MNQATPQHTYDHVFGSGALLYSWWLGTKTTGVGSDFKASDEWSVDVTADDGNDGKVTVTVNHASVLRAARQVIKEPPKYSSDALVRECKNLLFHADEADFDANSADELLQVLVLGGVVYG